MQRLARDVSPGLAQEHTSKTAAEHTRFLQVCTFSNLQAASEPSVAREVSRLSRYELTSILPTIPEGARHIVIKR